jgi:hypothetical protein
LLTSITRIGFNNSIMARPLVLTFGGSDIPLVLDKVERSDLYGFVEIESLDEQGRKCTLATLADDGRSIIGTGGTALVNLTPDGNWIEKTSLVPTDNQGNRITPVASSYSAPVPLENTASVDEYLSHDIRAVYQISSEVDLGPLLEKLKAGTIFQFPYSFRGGLDADVGFVLMSADGMPFLAVGSPTKLEFVGFEQTAAIAGDDDAEQEESLDFSMM